MLLRNHFVWHIAMISPPHISSFTFPLQFHQWTLTCRIAFSTNLCILVI